jgi:hypothetical protein
MRQEDQQILVGALRQNGGFHLATKWYFRNWAPLPYQYAWHHFADPNGVDILNSTVIAGIASGKTNVMAASYAVDCLSIPYFRALSTSVTARQAELGFDMFMSWYEDNPKLAHLVETIKLRPWPIVTFKIFSVWEFRTSGLNAKFIRGSEYDRISFDEAGLDPYGEVIKVLRGRLRGIRPDGNNTPRMARLDVLTSPTDAPWLKERYYRGVKDHSMENLDQYASARWATWDNTFLTEPQIEAMKAEYPPDMINVEMGGFFPDFGYTFFPSSAINACMDQSKYDACYTAMFPEDESAPIPGYDLQEDPRHGIYKFETPYRPGRIYISGGDPGSGSIPQRDSACVFVVDVTDDLFDVVYFHWISGRGSYNPFLNSYKYAIKKYQPVLRGIDATGSQKALDEIAFQNVGIETDRINFSTEKHAMLNMLKQDVTNHKWRYPQIKGLVRQLGVYTDYYDRKGGAQDIVMTMAEISWLKNFIPASAQDHKNVKNVRSSRRRRTKKTERR